MKRPKREMSQALAVNQRVEALFKPPAPTPAVAAQPQAKPLPSQPAVVPIMAAVPAVPAPVLPVPAPVVVTVPLAAPVAPAISAVREADVIFDAPQVGAPVPAQKTQDPPAVAAPEKTVAEQPVAELQPKKELPMEAKQLEPEPKQPEMVPIPNALPPELVLGSMPQTATIDTSTILIEQPAGQPAVKIVDEKSVLVWLKPIPLGLKTEITERTYRIGEFAFWQKNSGDERLLKKANSISVDPQTAKMLFDTGEIEAVPGDAK